MADTNFVKPWRALNPAIYETEAWEFSHGLDMFAATCAARGSNTALRYFDFSMDYNQLDRESDALAAALASRGFRQGDRLAVYLQNVPAFVIALIAAWKAGGSLTPINPMNRERELVHMLNDAQPQAMILETRLHLDVFSKLPAGIFLPATIITASPLDYQTRNDARVLDLRKLPIPDGAEDFCAVVKSALGICPAPLPRDPAAQALLVYTSGTTGQPKGAIISQAAIGYGCALGPAAYDLPMGASVLAMAPLFHTTGIMSTLSSSLYLGGALILTYRFDAAVTAEAIAEYRPAYTAGAPTALIALMNAPNAGPATFACFQAIGIGGAPVPPTIIETLRGSFGLAGQTGYGMTETGGACSISYVNQRDTIPVDPDSGALSIGFPCPAVNMWIADDDGTPLPPGATGEIIVQSPALMSGYWRNEQATAEALRADGLRTGDVGFMDRQGWFYLIDRKKDMIVASGYKVWPREVEDVLYSHPAVLEAGVVGIPDSYRGETVKAFIRLKAGASASADELQAYCKSKMAAYKYPRIVEIVDELPKTNTGKILRRALRG